MDDTKAPEGAGITLTEKEAHCIARLLQGAICGGNNEALDGCAFCKYHCSTETEPFPHYDEIRMKLWKLTGVDLRPVYGGERLPHSKFRYKKFLKNSNEDIKEYFRNFFKDA